MSADVDICGACRAVETGDLFGIGGRVPAGGGVAHFFEVDTSEPRRPWTLCGKLRRGTPYHPILHGVEEDWRPCRDCFARWHSRRGVEAARA